jgi:hypothetical protein
MICRDENSVFPSLEAFEEAIRMPTFYMVFYDYFFRSSVGDAEWRESSMQMGTADVSLKIAPIQSEAFAFLILRNNYFAWLLEVKRTADDEFVTDYDGELKIGDREDIGQVLLKMEIDIGDLDNGEDNEVEELLVPKESPKFAQLRGRTIKKIRGVRARAITNHRYKDLLAQLEREKKKEGEKNKRKLMREFREYTNCKDTKNRFKGWSHEASADMAEWIKNLAALGKKGQKFRKAYRLTFSAKNNVADTKKTVQKGPNINYQRDMWDLDSDMEKEEDDNDDSDDDPVLVPI